MPTTVRRRPRRAWFLVAVAALLAAGALLLVASDDGDVRERFDSGRPVTVDIPVGGVIVWASTADYDVRCEASGTDDVAWSTTTMRFVPVSREALGERWHASLLVEAWPPGSYPLVCTSAEGVGLAVGSPPLASTEAERLAAQAGAVLLAAAGVVSAVIVAVRRRSVRKS